MIRKSGSRFSMVASTRGVAFLPAYARNFLPGSVISRPIKSYVPTIDLVIDYNSANTSPTLKVFLSRTDELIARVSKKLGNPVDGRRGQCTLKNAEVCYPDQISEGKLEIGARYAGGRHQDHSCRVDRYFAYSTEGSGSPIPSNVRYPPWKLAAEEAGKGQGRRSSA
jgi:hypothetical protein